MTPFRVIAGVFLTAGVLGTFLCSGFAQEPDVSYRLGGSFDEKIAYGISEPGNFTELKSRLILSETGNVSPNLNFKISGRLSYDPVYRYTDTYPPQVRSDQELEYELRDTYLDYSRGPFDVRLGKQQIVWGEAVGIFFADVVNAKDYREFILPDFDQIRVPDWGMDLEYTKEKFHTEIVWLPVPQFNKYGVTGSEFAFPYPVPPNTSFVAQDPPEPDSDISNSEEGVRCSYLLNGWDMSAFYLYTWDKAPVMYRAIQGGVYHFSPRYDRLRVVGSTFSKEIGKTVLKGEFVFNDGAHFSIFDDTNPDGVVQRDYLNYVIGLDRTFLEKIDINLQFMQKVIFDYDPRIVSEHRVRNSVSLRVARGFFNDALEAEVFVIADVGEPDYMARPKVTYKFHNNWTVSCGLDIFGGQRDGVFGEFGDRDRVYTEMKYSF